MQIAQSSPKNYKEKKRAKKKLSTNKKKTKKQRKEITRCESLSSRPVK